jgi:hypothetical protein
MRNGHSFPCKKSNSIATVVRWRFFSPRSAQVQSLQFMKTITYYHRLKDFDHDYTKRNALGIAPCSRTKGNKIATISIHEAKAFLIRTRHLSLQRLALYCIVLYCIVFCWLVGIFYLLENDMVGLKGTTSCIYVT